MPINENEFESAICRCFPLLLPDLAATGYSIESSQAPLLSRRIDLFLRRSPEECMIVELKVGSPPVEELIAQVIDYKKCYAVSHPEQRIQVMVISTRITDQTRRRLQESGVQAREITEDEVLNALQAGFPASTVRKGQHLNDDERVDEIRQILSDKSFVQVPDGLALAPPWNQFKAFLALVVHRKQKHKNLWKKNPYVQLYPQSVNAALLYHISVKSASRGPIHINKNSAGWRQDFWAKVEHCVTYVDRDRGKQTIFDHYRVDDWNEFAKALELDYEVVSENVDVTAGQR